MQVEAIRNLEKSLAHNHPRALIQMATGSGKTFTAVTGSYRLIKFGKAKRILFLVDRNNLGKQAHNEFQQYVSPYNNYKFTEEYAVQRLRRNTIDPAAKVCITTIQRLYSILKGEEEFEEENEEGSLFEAATSLVKEPMPVVYNPKVPIETFDVIIVDECHRSIYNIWRQVLEYFDAFIIGLTATPTPQTIGFFNGNLVQDYSHEKAVVDGVNVGYDVYRIETKITDRRGQARQGAGPVRSTPRPANPQEEAQGTRRRPDLHGQRSRPGRGGDGPDPPGGPHLPRPAVHRNLPRPDRGSQDAGLRQDGPARRRHREGHPRGVRPGQRLLPEDHVQDHRQKARRLLNEFRNSYNPRIAVTVDMIATGTDVKPLECLIFMRNINSASYFEQMKGRGCRVIKPDDLQSVTPDAKQKTHFVIVDAVGVCERDKTTSKPLDRKPSVSLEKILNTVAAGAASDDLCSTLAARLDPARSADWRRGSGPKLPAMPMGRTCPP